MTAEGTEQNGNQSIIDAMSRPDNTGAPVDPNAAPKPEGGDGGAGGGADDKFKPQSYWEAFGIELPDALKVEKLPEGIDEKALFQAAMQNKAYAQLPQEVVEFNNHIAKGGSAEDFYKSKVGEPDFLSLQPEVYAAKKLKDSIGKTEQNPNGLTDEQIQDRIEKLKSSGMFEYQVGEWQKADKADFESKRPKPMTAEDMINQSNKVVDTFLGSVQGERTVDGVKYSQEEVESYKPMFKALFTYNEELGGLPFNVLTQDNNMLFDMTMQLFGAKEKREKLLSNAKEEQKKVLLDLLDIKELNLTGSSDVLDEKSIIGKLSTPEQKF